MELSTAIALIEKGIEKKPEPQIWADLGAGSGLFSQALASILAPASTIYAIDQQLHSIHWTHPAATLIRVTADIRDELKLPLLDGALMANVLHYLDDKSPFLDRLQKVLRKNGSMIIIEYDTTRANAWVPYPISFEPMKTLASDLGLNTRLLGTERSKFNSGSMYSALLTPAD